MEIKEGQPWILWPKSVSYGIDKGDIGTTFEGDCDFTISMRFSTSVDIPQKRTLFAKLPNYMGLDIEGDNAIFIFNIINLEGVEEAKYLWIDKCINEGLNILTIRYNKQFNFLELLVNDIVKLEHKLHSGEKLSKSDDPHIIFGAGNFPHNGFNLNYMSFDINRLLIAKNSLSYQDIIRCFDDMNYIPTSTVGLYDFNKKTEYKIYDFTGNCNFIHKII